MSNNLQLGPGWGVHTPNDGSKIGGVQPAISAFWRAAPLGTSAMLAVEGVSYATVEAYVSLPPIPNPDLQLSFDITVDAESLASLYLIETDLIRVKGGMKQNYSAQDRLDIGGMLQLAQADGSWVSSGIIVPPFQPGVAKHYDIHYAQDPLKLTYGTQAAVFDGQLGLVHPGLQNLAPVPTTWPDLEIVQFQITLKPLASGQAVGRAYILIDNVSLVAAQ